MSDENRATPPAIARLIVNALPSIMYISTICDVGCGPTGVWGKAALERFSTAKVLYLDKEDYRREIGSAFLEGDFLAITRPMWDRVVTLGIDFWVCNPPYPKAELFFERMRFFSHTSSKILMFLNAGWLEGKDRRKRVFDVFPPNLIIHLDGRIVDKTHPEESGTDHRGRIGIFWDLAHLTKSGETRCKWVGSDNQDDYRVR